MGAYKPTCCWGVIEPLEGPCRPSLPKEKVNGLPAMELRGPMNFVWLKSLGPKPSRPFLCSYLATLLPQLINLSCFLGHLGVQSKLMSLPHEGFWWHVLESKKLG